MFRWYVINTYSGHENKVKANLEHRIISMNQAPRFRRVVVQVHVHEDVSGQHALVDLHLLSVLRPVSYTHLTLPTILLV